MTAHTVDRQVEALARRQHGVFRRDQAAGLGATSAIIEARLARRAWTRLGAGLYALAALPPTWVRQVMAAQLSVPGSAVSYRAGGVLLQVPGLRPGGIDLTVGPAGTGRSRFATVHRRASPFPTTVVDGITVTTLPRVVIDLAAQLGAARFEATVEEVLASRMVTLEELRVEYERIASSRPRGSGLVRRVLESRCDGQVPAANELERALDRVMSDPRLPPSVGQATAPWWPGGAHRVDRFIPSWRRIIEADGRRWHTREADFDRDRARDHLAQRHGYEVTRFTYQQLVVEPHYALAVLLDIGRRATA